ncbi:MAG: class I SAM-dependent methyltransferase [Acetobacteraceae bacterium]
MDSRLVRIHELLLAQAAVAPGNAVLDVGCGTGTTTFAYAEAAGAAGRVVGIDVSAPMLEIAHKRIAERGLANVSLLEADAATHPFLPRCFDRIVSRFGVMFFADPVAAFRNLYTAMREGGHLAFVCWAPLKDNPFWSIPLSIAERALGPRDPGPEHAPGPLALSDLTWIRFVLDAAGFRRIEIATREVAIIGGSPDAEAAVACRMGPAGRFIEERATPTDVRDTIRREIARAFTPFASGATTALPATVHLVTAERAA